MVGSCGWNANCVDLDVGSARPGLAREKMLGGVGLQLQEGQERVNTTTKKHGSPHISDCIPHKVGRIMFVQPQYRLISPIRTNDRLFFPFELFFFDFKASEKGHTDPNCEIFSPFH